MWVVGIDREFYHKVEFVNTEKEAEEIYKEFLSMGVEDSCVFKAEIQKMYNFE